MSDTPTYHTLTKDNAPTLWPECDCHVPYVFERVFTMTGTEWMWRANCKHPKKEQHTPVLMTVDGPYVPPTKESSNEDQPS